MNRNLLHRIKELVGMATPAPWLHSAGIAPVYYRKEDQDFISCAREAVPEMLVEISDLEATVDLLGEELRITKDALTRIAESSPYVYDGQVAYSYKLIARTALEEVDPNKL